MSLPDVVYVVRPSEVNEQLRYSLRSLSNLPHGRVWIAGYCPSWITGVGRIPVQQDGSKYQNSTRNLRAACEHSEVSETFTAMNDDFFVMQSQPDGMPVLHRGPVRNVEAYYATRAQGKYLRGMQATRDLLVERGHPDPLSYELHVPMPVHKRGMLYALDVGRHLDVVHKRSLYGNLAQLGGEEIADVKIMHRAPRGYSASSPFLSTMPDSFVAGHVGQYIRRSFPQACRYETRRR